MRISDWSSDVCSSDLEHIPEVGDYHVYDLGTYSFIITRVAADDIRAYYNACLHRGTKLRASGTEGNTEEFKCTFHGWTWNLDGSHKETLCDRSEEHTSELQSLMRISYAVFCLNKKTPYIGNITTN